MIFPFDAKEGRPNWPSVFEKPFDYASHEWSQHRAFSSLEEACDYARIDIEVYNALWNWAVQHKDTLPDSKKVLIFDALIQGDKPKKSFSKSSDLRDLKMLRIARVLTEQYNLKFSRRRNNQKQESAASIIARLQGTPSERPIENLLRPYFQENDVDHS